MNWKDPEKAETLARLWDEGHSCTVIARMMGAVSRNSVIGAVRRQNLPFRGYRPGGTVAKHSINHKRSRPQALGGKIARANAGKAFRFQTSPNMVRQIEFTPEPPPMPAADDVARVSFNDLNEDGNRHCKWPCLQHVSDVPQDQPMFCGLEPEPGLPYCRAHAKRAYPMPAPRFQDFPPNVVPMPKRETVAA